MKKLNKHITLILAVLMLITVILPTEVQAATATKPVITSTQATIQKNAAVISKGAKVTLKATSNKKNITTKAAWKSSKPSVASVSKKGIVSAKKAGTTYITAKYNGKTSAKLKITVAQTTLSKSSVKIAGGKTYKLTATYNKKTVKPTYKSSNTEVATIDKNGKITALKKGTATITAMYKNSKATCKVTVTSNPNTETIPATEHKYKMTQNSSVRHGIACNECYADLTDWDDYYACHGAWHTHTWYTSPTIWTCEYCGQKVHKHTWHWVKPAYYYNTDTIAAGGYFECTGCGANTRDENGILERIDLWTTPYDFTDSNVTIETGTFPDKGDVWELERLGLNTNGGSKLLIGETMTLEPVYTPVSTTTDKSLSWKSSNPAVAVVNNGIVTGISSGTTTITATAQNGISCSLQIDVIEESHAVTDFSILVDGENVTDNTLTFTKTQLSSTHSIQIVPTGSENPQYTASISETGLAEFYYDNETYRGIFSVANYQTSETGVYKIIGWDGQLDMKLRYSDKFTNTTVSISMKDEEGHLITHTICCMW